MTLEAIFKAVDQITPVVRGIETNTRNLEKTTSSAMSNIGTYFKGALSVSAVIGFGKSLLDAADATVKLSDKTGIAIEPLQRLKYIAEQSGNSIDEVSKAVTQMQDRLAGGDKSAVKALDTLGL